MLIDRETKRAANRGGVQKGDRMNDVVVQFEPLGQWPRAEFTTNRRRSPFKSDWPKTWQLLRYELGRLDVENAVLRIDVDRYWIRVDGGLRGGSSPASPCVVLNFATPASGPIVMPCDVFDQWRDNVRAIALALEALRAVDRYGVTSRAEQYRGWAALPPPSRPDFDNAEQAREFLRKLLRVSTKMAACFESIGDVEETIREAEMISHPDRGGDPEDFKRVQSARKLLLPRAAGVM